MKRYMRSRLVLFLGLLVLATPLSPVLADEKAAVPAGGTVNVNVTTAAAAPPVSIILHDRHGRVTPWKGKCTHTGGGLIDVAQPSSDVVVITMSGVVVANASMKFDLDQCFEISFDDPKVKKARLTVEGRVVGLLRGEPHGCAEFSDACAHVACGPTALLSVCVPPHSVCKCESQAVNDHDGPKGMPVFPGKFTLNQTFLISAQSKCFLFKRPSAEFAPDPALDPIWINYYEPFHGVKKDAFGFQVTLKVAQETEEGNGDKKADEGNGGKKEGEQIPLPKEKIDTAPKK
jgi:hypothetical protein